jgi:hypothetical protein
MLRSRNGKTPLTLAASAPNLPFSQLVEKKYPVMMALVAGVEGFTQWIASTLRFM